MHGVLIVYHLRPPHDPNRASAFVKKLYGQKTSSHKGRYTYRRKGLLDDIPSIRLIRGVLIVRPEDKATILSFLESFDAEVFIREVVLTKEDMKELQMED